MVCAGKALVATKDLAADVVLFVRAFSFRPVLSLTMHFVEQKERPLVSAMVLDPRVKPRARVCAHCFTCLEDARSMARLYLLDVRLFASC